MAGIIIDATVGLSDPEMIDAIERRYRLIEQRADNLARVAVESDQPWVTAVRQCTQEAKAESAMLIVAAYRERWDISGEAPLGPRPDQSADRNHHADYQRLSAMLYWPTGTSGGPAIPSFGHSAKDRDRHL